MPAPLIRSDSRDCPSTLVHPIAGNACSNDRRCIHHTDHCAQYASADYAKKLEFYGFKISMSRKGNPPDNVFAESLIKTIKTEEVYLWEYRATQDAQGQIPYFIEDVYNQKWLYSSLGYLPPCEYEALMLNQEPDKTALLIAHWPAPFLGFTPIHTSFKAPRKP